MMEWRNGIEPDAYFEEIRSSFTVALEARPDILPCQHNPSFMAILSVMFDWGLPFNTDPPNEDDLKYEMIWLDRWIIAGLSDPSCAVKMASAPATGNKFINTCLTDYGVLLADQIDPEEGIRRCLKNYNRRATHPTFKTLSSHYGGASYNELFVDYSLAAILKKRGLTSNSVHDWVW
jgi:hypothetical protein